MVIGIGYSMMGGYGYHGWAIMGFLSYLLLLGLVILVYLWIWKLWRGLKNEGKAQGKGR